jgi:hypothetical protein
MTNTPCPSCSSDTPDGLLCQRCTDTLKRELDALPEWLSHLDDALARQTQTGTGNGGRKGETPVPYDTNASRVSDDVRNTLTTWVRELNLGDAWPANTCQAMVRWLRARVERIRGHAAAGEIVDEVGYCVIQIRRAVDVGGARWYLGPCRGLVGEGDDAWPCANQLYCPAHSAGYSCPRCHTTIDVDERRSEMFELIENQYATIESCVSVLTLFGLAAKLATLKRWAAMDAIPDSRVVDGVRKYRVGSVADIARDALAERSARRA